MVDQVPLLSGCMLPIPGLGYRSGHMMYLRAEDLKKANDDLRQFISNALPGKGNAAKYEANNSKSRSD